LYSRSVLAGDAVLVGAALVLTLTCLLTVERVQVGNGFGWDGVVYGNWARHFYEEVVVTRVDAYHVQRILPAAVVHYSMRLLGVRRTDAAILRAFGLYAVAMLTLAAWAWCGIARKLELSLAGKWLGFVGLFVNYTALKYVYYVPAGTEATAYALGTLMLWAYLCDRPLALAVMILLGAFDWPACLQVGVLLLIFPHTDPSPRGIRSVPRAVPVAAAGVLTAAAAVWMYAVLRTPPTLQNVFVEPQYIDPYRPALPLSAAISLAYLCLGAFPLLDWDRLYDLRWLFARRHVLSAMLVGAGALILQAAQRALSVPAPFEPLSVVLRQTVFASVVEPAVFLVAHIAFFGPMFLLVMFLWKETCRHLHDAGMGVTLAVFLGLLLSLNSQSRFLINMFPLLLPFVVKAADARRWGAAPYALMLLSSVALSKVWFTINTGPFTGRLHEFPDQGLFMTHGPWISPKMYAVQGALFLVLGAVMYGVMMADWLTDVRLRCDGQ
jgi:hypothetical protein